MTGPAACGRSPSGGPARPEAAAPDIRVGGLTPLSTADWPGMLAAVIFCQGCAWACPYCHNPTLRPAGGKEAGPDERPWPEVLEWLGTRVGLLEAVVFSGGEPLLQPGLAAAMREVHDLGFAIGLHTSGMDPEAFARVLPLLGWAGLDIKAPRPAYDRITGRPGGAAKAWRSFDLLRAAASAAGGPTFEVRTTWHPALLSEAELLALAGELAQTGPLTWAVQAFQPQGCADSGLAETGRVAVPTALADSLRAALAPGSTLLVRE